MSMRIGLFAALLIITARHQCCAIKQSKQATQKLLLTQADFKTPRSTPFKDDEKFSTPRMKPDDMHDNMFDFAEVPAGSWADIANSHQAPQVPAQVHSAGRVVDTEAAVDPGMVSVKDAEELKASVPPAVEKPREEPLREEPEDSGGWEVAGGRNNRPRDDRDIAVVESGDKTVIERVGRYGAILGGQKSCDYVIDGANKGFSLERGAWKNLYKLVEPHIRGNKVVCLVVPDYYWTSQMKKKNGYYHTNFENLLKQREQLAIHVVYAKDFKTLNSNTDLQSLRDELEKHSIVEESLQTANVPACMGYAGTGLCNRSGNYILKWYDDLYVMALAYNQRADMVSKDNFGKEEIRWAHKFLPKLESFIIESHRE